MSWWTTVVSGLKAALGIGASAAAGASGNPIAAVAAGAGAVSEVSKAAREAGRGATERAIAKEKAANDLAIDEAVKKATVAALLLMLLLGTGCASVPSRDSATSSGNVERLLARPDFDPAAKAAPEWVRDSLKTVNSLEVDLQRERARANEVP